jgi:hypothetical protein
MVDRFPDSDVPAIEKLLESLTEGPSVRAMRLALPDDEPVTAAEEAAISEAESDTRTPVPLEDLLAEYGMK